MLSTQEMHDRVSREPKHAANVRRPYDPGRGIYLSEAGGCARKTTLRLLRYAAEQPSDEQRKRWNVGLMWEQYFALLWRSWYPKRVVSQAYVRTPYGNGKIDIFLLPALDLTDIAQEASAAQYIEGCKQRAEYPHVVEAKTLESKERKFLPKRSHMDQCLMYQHFYDCIEIDGAKYTGPRPTGEVVYGLIDTNEVLSYPCPYDEARMQELLDWLNRVQKATWAKTPPPMPEDAAPDKFPCGGEHWRCSYFAHCWGEEDGSD